ncbi:MarR family transcriptional regulator [Kovacikia minuta CCNUW1]|uniref:MarR family winged helix-turn-helix transcriptional regulator n=1 Tax=Kovacikia minuta TaxID=2931930 RepID=UPI001CCBE45C|nr:MarR family transcriptional regulator [Kovacikia minuta]UBF28832.1 MarR family transcriptional regulator [Kovacikia minuta CCNUW1]
MKRRTPQGKALNKQRQPLDTQSQGTQSLIVPAYLPPEEPIPECLGRWTGNLLYWVSSLGAQYYAQVVAPLGLTPAQIAVLQVLEGEGMMRQARLTDRTHIDKATMVGLLNNLEEQGLIERRASPIDKRAFDIYLTEQGGERVRQVEQVSQEAEDQFYAALSAEERQTLRALLSRLMTRTNENAKK